VKDSENLKWLASGLIDDEVREKPVEKNPPTGEIGAAMAGVWYIGQIVETFGEISDDAVRRLQTLLLQKVKPDGIDIEEASSVS